MFRQEIYSSLLPNTLLSCGHEQNFIIDFDCPLESFHSHSRPIKSHGCRIKFRTRSCNKNIKNILHLLSNKNEIMALKSPVDLLPARVVATRNEIQPLHISHRRLFYIKNDLLLFDAARCYSFDSRKNFTTNYFCLFCSKNFLRNHDGRSRTGAGALVWNQVGGVGRFWRHWASGNRVCCQS